MYHKAFSIIFGAFIALCLWVSAASAAPASEVSDGDADLMPYDGTYDDLGSSSSQEAMAEFIAQKFSLTVEQVMSVRETGLGWGEVFKVFSLTNASHKAPERIVELRQSGLGWGEVAKSSDVEISGKGQSLGQAVSSNNGRALNSKSAQSSSSARSSDDADDNRERERENEQPDDDRGRGEDDNRNDDGDDDSRRDRDHDGDHDRNDDKSDDKDDDRQERQQR